MASGVDADSVGQKSRIVLFVCWENSFRSQIAEAYFNSMAPPGWRAISAGVEPADRVHPNAVALMLEEGMDISGKRPRRLTPEMQEEADIGVVVCGESSAGRCPVVYTREVYHWGVPDPANLPIEEARMIRDEIKRRVIELIEMIKSR